MAAILIGFLGLKLVVIYALVKAMQLPFQERPVFTLLLTQGIAPTVLDHNPDSIELARAFGYRVFYGDATLLYLLRMAGTASATILMVAVDSVEHSIRIVDLAKEHFPHLQTVARAKDVTHWMQLRDWGIMRVERELFEPSIKSARSILELLGHSPHEACQHAMRFRQHNLALFEQLYPHRKDCAKVIAVAKQGRAQLEEQIAKEREQRAHKRPAVSPAEAVGGVAGSQPDGKS